MKELIAQAVDMGYTYSQMMLGIDIPAQKGSKESIR